MKYFIFLFILSIISCTANKTTVLKKIEIPEIDHFEIQNDSLNISLVLKNEHRKINSYARIIATGDIMLGTCIPDESYVPEDFGTNLFSDEVQQILKKGDVTFGNLEGAVCGEEGEPKNKKYVFAMPLESADVLKEVGYNLLSTANNHALDMGQIGKRKTQFALLNANIKYAGFADVPITQFEENGIVYGFIAVAPVVGVISLHNEEWLAERVKELDKTCNIVIISMHIGAEGPKHQHINRKTEFFMKENRGNPYRFARTMIDAGADVILGHGPHVSRAVDIYKGRFIAYSMGNFCTVSRMNINGITGIAPIIEIITTKDGSFLFGKIHSTKQAYHKGVLIDKEQQAHKIIKKLTETDFPESELKITDNGEIYKQNKY